MSYHVYDGISGDSEDIAAKTPKEAAIRYLQMDTEPKTKGLEEWIWELNVSRIKSKS